MESAHNASATDGLVVRSASVADLAQIQGIYNEGILDRIATLDLDPKDDAAIAAWFSQHGGRYPVVVASNGAEVLGWGSLNRYSLRSAYDGVADVSLYISRTNRGKGLGKLLLHHLESVARTFEFYKLVLLTFPFNEAGQRLYRGLGFREVGTLLNHGRLDGKFVDVMVMEKQLI